MFDSHLVVEGYLAGDWTDVSSYVRTASGVQITRGRANEAKQADPQQCTLTLDNTDGRFSVRNPTGPYFGTISRNSPIRVAVRAAKDAFGRTVSSGWGTLDFGGGWNVGLGAGGTVQFSDWNVGSGVATHSVPAAAAYRVSFLDLVNFADVDVAASFSLAVASATGGDLEPTLVLRAVSNTDYYMARARVNGTSFQLTVMHFDGTILATANYASLTYSAGTKYRIRAQVEGRTVRAKLWAASSPEPLGWHAVGSDTVTRTSSPGEVGIRSGVASGNSNAKPVVFSWDDFEVRQPRFAGEVAEWPNAFSLSGKDLTASITAAGLTRRIGTAVAPLKTAAQRFITNWGTAVAYWPLDDPNTAVSAAPLAGAQPMTGDVDPANPSTPNSGALGWGADTTNPALISGVTSHAGASLTGLVTMSASATSWSVGWMMKYTGAAAAAGWFVGQNGWTVGWSTSTSDGELLFSRYDNGPSGGLTAGITFPTPTWPWNGVWHAYVLSAVQSGGNVVFTLEMDGTTIGTATQATTLSPLKYVQFKSQPLQTTDVAFAQVSAWAENMAGVSLTTAMTGWDGETAGTRIARLCAEQGVDLVRAGDYTVSQQMGPQRPDNLINLVRECAAVDMGTLAEARGTNALFYRTLDARTNRPTVVSAAFTDLGAVPAPVDDDSATVNDVTVKLTRGGQYQLTLASGALSTLDPGAGGVGRKDKAYTLNAYNTSQLPGLAGWLLGLGTVDQARWPTLTFLREAAGGTLAAALLLTDLDSRVVVAASPTYKIYDDVQQLVAGYTETISVDGHRLVFNCVPEEPFHVGVVDDSGVSRVDHAAAYTNATLTTTATSMAVKSNDGTLWTTDAAEFPFDVIVAGERMTVTNCTGSSSPQTMTVTRSVNGVVKTHAANEQVALFRPCYTGLE